MCLLFLSAVRRHSACTGEIYVIDERLRKTNGEKLLAHKAIEFFRSMAGTVDYGTAVPIYAFVHLNHTHTQHMHTKQSHFSRADNIAANFQVLIVIALL